MKKDRIKKVIMFLFLGVFVINTEVYAGGKSESGGTSVGSSSSTESKVNKNTISTEGEYTVVRDENNNVIAKWKNGSGESSNSSWEKRSFLSQIFGAIRNLLGIESSTTSQSINSAKEAEEKNEKTAKSAVEETAEANTAQDVGDPVLLTSGSYIQREEDISLRTYAGRIVINRIYISGKGTGGGMGGTLWTLSTEERIIRGYTTGAEEAAKKVEGSLAELNGARKEAEEAWSKKDEYEADEPFTTEFAAEIKQAGETAAEAEREIKRYRAIAEKAEKLKGLNRYSSYGEAAKNEGTGNDSLIVVLEGYIPVVFDYKGEGKWEAHEKKYRNEYSLESRNGKDALEANGFMLKSRDGTSKSFNKWGQIESLRDRNGNETKYERDEQQRIKEIKSDTGEQSLRFSYSGEGLVTKIELYEGESPAGESVSYTYRGKQLETVTDTDGDESRFVYNADGNLEKLIKPDGSYVEFRYGATDREGNLLTTETVNEEGHAEKFDYDRTNRITTYTDHDGVTTVYRYDEKHQIVEQKEADGTVIKTTYDEAGNVLTRSVDGTTTKYEYDSKDNLLKVQYADGSKESFEYDGSGNCKKAVDRDGIATEFRYDAKGNCTGLVRGGIEAVTAAYDSRGLVTDIYRNGGNGMSRTSFVYDGKGNAVTKETYTRQGTIRESWTYDSRNRVTEYMDGEGQKYAYSYSGKTVTEKTPAGLERIYTTNGRKDLIRIEETDTKTGEKRVFSYEYDRRHLVREIKAGSSEKEQETIVSYTYTKAGKAQSETRTDVEGSWITEYVYDGAGRVESVKRSKTDVQGNRNAQPVTQKYAYARTSSGRDFTVISPEGNRTVVTYDRWNRVTDIKNALEEKSHRGLSHAGRTLKEESAHGGIYTFGYDSFGNMNSLGEQGKKQAKVEYNPDGSTKSVTDRLGNRTAFEYDERGLLVREESPSSATVYTYDNVGRIKGVRVGSPANQTKETATQYAEYEYSEAGRKVKVTCGGKYETTYTLNAWGEVTAVTDGEGNTRKYEYDELGRTKAAYDGYGEKYRYTYNAIGRVSSLTAPDGSQKKYEYNELYLVTKAEDGEGVFFEGTYNRDGLLTAEKTRPGVNREYGYDKLGRIVEVRTGGEVTERYSYTGKGRTVTFTDGKGSDYAYSYDEFGRLTQEKNRLGAVQGYTYNENGELKGKKDFEGKVTEILHDERSRTERTKYDDGTERIIVYDECGNILSASNESGTLTYEYDKAGFLVRETDGKTGESVSYTYDRAGRRTRLVSRERDISYAYGRNGELVAQKDRAKRLEVSYKYDRCGRETERRFGNGVRQLTVYDRAGRAVCMKQVNSSGRLLTGESYVYDRTGRRSMSVNEKGLVTVYKYDRQSRLETVYYPFNEDIKETARKEAEKQGLYFEGRSGNPENYYLSAAELGQARVAAELMAGGRGGAVTVNQVVWKESYEYDANGNRTGKSTAWGKISYEYDGENRLRESGEIGKRESVRYEYDANGNLLKEEAERYRKTYAYNAQNRMEFSDVQDGVLNTRNITEYVYDAFGRRAETREYLGQNVRSLYDGFGFEVLGRTVLEDVRSGNGNYKTRTGSDFVNTLGVAQQGTTSRGTRYRYIEENPLVGLAEAGNADVNAGAAGAGIKGRSRSGSEAVLYGRGEPVAVSEGGVVSYFGTDITGSVRSVTDGNGAVESEYSYDAFGSPYLGSLESGLSFGYCGKVFDCGTGLYDYGFRDYSPASGRFTTVDPIRDGSNWFSYVVNDPVNFRDPWGLDTVDVSFAFKFDATEKNIYYDNYGRPSFDPHVVNGFNVGERSVVEQKSNKTTTVQIFSDNTIVVTSSSSTKIGVIIFDGTFNENNAEKGTVKMYDISCSSITITSTTTAVASAPIVSGGNDYNRTQHGIYLDIKKENIMEVSGSKVLRDGNHGDYYYRLNKVTGEALHLGNQTVNIDYQKTEGCSAITGLNEEEIRKNNDILLDQGDDCATFIVF